MGEMRWEEPPPRKYGPAHTLEPIRQALIANPGKWACIRDYSITSSVGPLLTRINKSVNGWEGYRWQATSRRVNDRIKVYVRCLGPVDGVS